MRMRSTRLRPVAWFALVAVLGAGCGGSTPAPKRPECCPTKGTVTYNGQPAKGLLVTFWPLPLGPQASLVKPQGLVGADGAFVPHCYGVPGSPEGEFAVTLRWAGESGGVGADLLHGRYADAEKPVMTVTIKKGDNALPPIELKGPPVNPRATVEKGPDDT